MKLSLALGALLLVGSSSVGCQLVAGIQDPVLESDSGPEDGGVGSDAPVGVDAPAPDATADATPPEDGGNVLAQDGATGDDAGDAGAACTPGGSCTPANPCVTGQYVCGDAGLTCAASGNVPNGTVCGSGKVCSEGACASCATGTDCTPANSCTKMTVSCATGMSSCVSAGNEPDGTSCGTNLYCNAGTCAACTPGAPCVPPGNACHLGTTSCSNGTATCADTGSSAPDGTSCGTNEVCSAGACVACTANLSCTPTNVCHTGLTSCATGGTTCNDTGASLTNGASCGTNEVCDNGACSACTPGATCTPANACHAGTTSCATGVSACADTATNLANGTSCGTNDVCDDGVCGSCTKGASCTPANACHTGTTSCASGVATCTDTGASAANGTGCGSNEVCQSGVCTSCTPGASCSANACQIGTLTCSAGPACELSLAPNGTTCGTNVSCDNGVCSTDLTWAQWHMPNDPTDVAAGAPNPESYTTGTGASAGTVTDNVTGLMWQQSPTGGATFAFAAAATACTGLTLAGHTDWRVPTLIELLSIVEFSVMSGAAINATYFPSTQATYYWSSTPSGVSAGSAWAVNFGILPNVDDISETYASVNVRCVRGGTGPFATLPFPAPAGRYTKTTTGAFATVYDTKTALTWQTSTTSTGAALPTLATPVNACTSFGIGWRLPTLGELMTLVDYSQPGGSTPMIDASFFPSVVPGNCFWSATEEGGGVGATEFGTGDVYWTGIGGSDACSALCVAP